MKSNNHKVTLKQPTAVVLAFYNALLKKTEHNAITGRIFNNLKDYKSI